MKDVRIIIPAYFYPSGDGLQYWGDLASKASSYGNKIVAIGNPNNGAGSSKDTTYETVFNNFKNAGGFLLGYVHTSYTNRSLTDVKADIDNWYNWYSPYGIFLDEVTNDDNDEHFEYYQEIYDYIKTKDQWGSVFGNQGCPSLFEYLIYNNARVFDVIVNLESSTNYLDWENSAWVYNYSRDNFACILYNCSSVSTAEDYVDHAVSGDGHCKYIYITDDTIPGNAYDSLPSYFNALCTYCFV